MLKLPFIRHNVTQMQLYRILLLIIYKKIWSFHFIYVILLHIIMTYRLLLLLLPLLFMTSCQDGRWRLFGLSAEEEEQVRLSLSLADSLMEDNPDSAMAVLRRDSALVLRADINERMMYALLKTQADDKLYVTHKSDSTIREVAKYFNEHGDARQQAQAWYLLGRVSYDLNHTSSALSAWKKALAVEEEIPVVFQYKAKSASWLGGIYEKEKMYKELLSCSHQAFNYAKRSDRAKELISYSLRNIGRSYSYLKDNKRAISYYKKALNQAGQMPNDEICQMIDNELAAIYIEEGLLQEAGKILIHPLRITSTDDLAPYYYTKGRYYEAKGEMDSSVIYYRKNIAIASIYSKTLTIRHLIELYDKQNNHIEARKYRELGKIYEDSLTLLKQAETHDNDKNVEEKIEMQRKNEELAHNRLIIIICSCLLGTLPVAIVFLISRKYKKNRKHFLDETKHWQRIHEQDMDKMQQSQEQIVKLQSDLTSKNSIIVSGLNKSTIYTAFTNVKYQPSLQDFSQLEDVLNCVYDNFTERLKLCYPELSKEDIRLCCMLKIGIPIKTIGVYLRRSSSSLSMMRKRLYEKFFNKEGKPADFDAFVKEF